MTTLNEEIVNNAKISDKIYYVRDDKIIGFGLKVIPNRRKKYVLRYKTSFGGRKAKQKCYIFGENNIHTCMEARELTANLMKDVFLKKDPQEIKVLARKSLTFNEFWLEFNKRYVNLKEKSVNYRRNSHCIWNSLIAPFFSSMRISDITMRDIEKFHREHIDTKYFANRGLSLLHLMFNLMERWGYRPKSSNPCDGIIKYKENYRIRYLSKQEIKNFVKQIIRLEKKEPLRVYSITAIKLLLLTGARKNEILTCKWQYIDFDRRIINLPDSKTGPKTIYLNSKAIKILKTLQKRPEQSLSPYIIKNKDFTYHLMDIKKTWIKLLENTGISNFRVHDIRHTVASLILSKGHSLSEIACILGHKSIAMSQKYAHLANETALKVTNTVSRNIRF